MQMGAQGRPIGLPTQLQESRPPSPVTRLVFTGTSPLRKQEARQPLESPVDISPGHEAAKGPRDDDSLATLLAGIMKQQAEQIGAF